MGREEGMWREVLTSGAKWGIVWPGGQQADAWQDRVFLGEDTHTIDAKGRVVMPARFRAALTDGCVVTTGNDRQLLVYPTETYAERAREINALPRNREGNRIRMMFFSGADEQSLDKAGRLLVRQELRDYASLPEAGEVKVVGMFDHIALWEPQAYDTERSAAEEVFLSYEEDGAG